MPDIAAKVCNVAAPINNGVAAVATATPAEIIAPEVIYKAITDAATFSTVTKDSDFSIAPFISVV